MTLNRKILPLLIVFFFSLNFISAQSNTEEVMYLKFDKVNGSYLIDEAGNFNPIIDSTKNIIKDGIIDSSLYLDNPHCSSWDKKGCISTVSCNQQQVRIGLGTTRKDYSEGFEKIIYEKINPIEEEFTIEAYVVLFDKWRQPLLSEFTNPNGGPEPLIEFLEDNKIRVNVVNIYNETSGVASDFYLESEETLMPQKIYHIALVYNKPYIQIWINGKKDSQKKIEKLRPFFKDNDMLIIGRTGYKGTSCPHFNGLIDELKITEEAKTEFNLDTSILLKEITKEEIMENIKEEERIKKELENDIKAWELASKVGTIESYKSYFTDYPNGTYSFEANSLIEQLEEQQKITDLQNQKELKKQKKEEFKEKLIFWIWIIFFIFLFWIYKIRRNKKELGEKRRLEKEKLKFAKSKKVKRLRPLKKQEISKNSLNDYVRNESIGIPMLRNVTNLNEKIFKDKELEKIDKTKLQEYIEELPLQKIPKDALNGLKYSSDSNLSLFTSFITNSKKTIDIITHDFSEKILVDLLNYVRDKKIRVRIITYSINEKGYLSYFKKKYPNISMEIRKMKKIHGKLIIRDNKKVLLGSANLDQSSLNKNYEVNIVFEKNKELEKAIELFESLWLNKNKIKGDAKSNLLFSKDDNSGLPLYLKSLFENEEKITIAMNLNAIDSDVLDKIKKWNKNLKINLITGDIWSNQAIDKDKIKSFNFLKLASNKRIGGIEVFPKKIHIHAKTYIFEKQGIIFVSSQNLTNNSWTSELEIGFLLKDKKELKNILKNLNEFSEGKLGELNIDEINKPELKWTGSEFEGKILGIPWRLLGERKPDFLPKKGIWKYFKLNKKERKKQGEKGMGGKLPPIPPDLKKSRFPLNEKMWNYLKNNELSKKERSRLIKKELRELEKEDKENKISLELFKSEFEKLNDLKIKTENELSDRNYIGGIARGASKKEQQKQKEFLEKIKYKNS